MLAGALSIAIGVALALGVHWVNRSALAEFSAAIAMVNGDAQAQLVGLDLSSAYLRQANRWLSQLPDELPQLVQGNGESMPFASGSMQGVTCVFLLHEMPGDARQNVIDECFRVLEPGGVLVLADSVQLADSPQFETAMDNFRRVFHEPYYRDYIGDDIEARLTAAGFGGIRATSHLMTRVWNATKP